MGIQIKAKNFRNNSQVEVPPELLWALVMKQKAVSETVSITVGDRNRDAGRAARIENANVYIAHTYTTDPEDLLKKPIKDAGNTSLEKSAITEASPRRSC